MKILADRHHDGLLYSLHLLFEKRLGHTLYVPIGEEWYSNGYWDVAVPYENNPATIAQYLSLNQDFRPVDGTPQLNKITGEQPTHYEVKELAHGFTIKAITFQQFLDLDIDIIIASIPDHWRTYTKLRDVYKSKARVICQMGNMFNEIQGAIRDGIVRNLLASTSNFPISSHINAVFYHQEIDTKVFTSSPISTSNKVTSIVNLLPARDLYNVYKNALPDYTFKAYGSSCPDGFMNTIQEIANTMRESSWAYHVKPQGDGFGHIWYDWGFVGRPYITNYSDYRDKLGGELFEDGVTGIDLERGTVNENVERIRKLSEPATLYQMGAKLAERTREIVDYEREGQEIGIFIDNLV